MITAGNLRLETTTALTLPPLLLNGMADGKTSVVDFRLLRSNHPFTKFNPWVIDRDDPNFPMIAYSLVY